MVLDWQSASANGADILLASASPRRVLICERAGLRILQKAPGVEECTRDGDPDGTVEENARRKLMWAMPAAVDLPVVSADTVVSLDGQVLGKPGSLDEARSMLMGLSGKMHRVCTGLGFAAPGQDPIVQVVESQVRFLELTPERVEAYIERVTPLDKAGGYDIDQSSELLVASYEGSYTNIMGLPVDHLIHLLARSRS